MDIKTLLLFGLLILFITFSAWESEQLNKWEHFGWKILRSNDCKLEEWKDEAYRNLGSNYRP